MCVGFRSLWGDSVIMSNELGNIWRFQWLGALRAGRRGRGSANLGRGGARRRHARLDDASLDGLLGTHTRGHSRICKIWFGKDEARRLVEGRGCSDLKEAMQSRR
jgi:hypothetical protein